MRIDYLEERDRIRTGRLNITTARGVSEPTPDTILDAAINAIKAK